MLFGDVRQVKEVCEGARDRQRVVKRNARELVGQYDEVRTVATPPALGERAHAFDRLEDSFPGLCFQSLAEQLTEQPHVVASP